MFCWPHRAHLIQNLRFQSSNWVPGHCFSSLASVLLREKEPRKLALGLSEGAGI